MIVNAAREGLAILSLAAFAQAIEPAIRERFPGSYMEILIYVALSCVAGAARTLYDTRSGRAPRLFVLVRGIVVSMFAGGVVAFVLSEYDIAPGYKAAWVLVAAFFADSTIGLLKREAKDRVERFAGAEPLPPVRKPDAGEGKP